LHNYSKHVAVDDSPLELVRRSSLSRRDEDQAARQTKPARQLREREVDELVARYRDVRNIRQVAREFKMSRTTVAKHLADRGIDSSHRMTAAQIERAALLYVEGHSSQAIGLALGFDNKTVIKELRAAGVRIRTALGR
jgi:AraC-like DNA-binding protein